MSWILAVETSTEWCSVALGRIADGGALECLVRHEHTGPRSSSRVLPAARELLAEAGSAAAVFGERLKATALALHDVPEALPAAPALVSIALRALARNETVAAADAMPIYLRDKVAQTIAERQAVAAQRAALAAAGDQ